MTRHIFTHSGDLGDIIYSLPAIRAKGGGKLILFDNPKKTAHGMTEAKMLRLKPLLLEQSYITDVEFSESPLESSLNGFRDHGSHGNLTDMHLATQGFTWQERATPWITVRNKRTTYDVVIHRSARYHNNNFPWNDIVNHYYNRIGFMGLEEEYKTFCRIYGEVPLIEANDFLAMAEVINGCKLYIGNQSSPLAIAHGMFKDLIMEISPGNAQQHCVFQRMNCIIGWDRKIHLPTL
jgi:hypothetical protein